MRLRSLTFCGLILVWLFLAAPARSESFGDFFRKLGNSIAHPKKHPAPRPKNDKSHSTAASPTPVNAVPAPTPTEAPNVVIRAASQVTGAKGAKRDLPYGIPVPNKQGFVTSPFAPNEGVVDVRGIPSGTEVKDPYTGKSFLTP